MIQPRDDRDRQILALRQAGKEFKEIAALVGGRPNTVAVRFYRMTGRHKTIASYAHHDQAERVRAPAAVLADRDDRIARLAERDARDRARGNVTAGLFGDPPPGCSALERRAS